MTSIILSRASAPRSACPDHSPRSPASSPSSTTSRTSRPAAAAAGTRRLSGTTSCMSRPTAAPPAGAGAEGRSAPRLQGCGPCPPPAGSGRDRPPGGAPLGRCRVFSGRLRGCCTFERGAHADGFRVFRTIPQLFLERQFLADGLPCAERTLLHMGDLNSVERRNIPHDSADPPPAGLGRMCSASPTGPMPHIRPARHQPDTASTTPIPHSPYRAVAPTPGPAPPFLVRKAR